MASVKQISSKISERQELLLTTAFVLFVIPAQCTVYDGHVPLQTKVVHLKKKKKKANLEAAYKSGPDPI